MDQIRWNVPASHDGRGRRLNVLGAPVIQVEKIVNGGYLVVHITRRRVFLLLVTLERPISSGGS